MALRVPRGIALRGFSRSPDKFAPAIIPVTAGKKMAKTCQKLASSNSPTKGIAAVGSFRVNKNDNMDNATITIIKY